MQARGKRRLLGLAILLAAAACFGLWRMVSQEREAARARRDATAAEKAAEIRRLARRDEASPAGGTTPANREAVVEGEVSGRYGGLWGVKVTAEGPSRRSIATTVTDSKGHYLLRLPAPFEFHLLVEPGNETGLDPFRSTDFALGPGERLVRDIVLERALRLNGRVQGYPGWGTRVIACELSALERVTSAAYPQPGEIRGVARENGRIGVGGKFSIDGLRPGRYRLLLDSHEYLFEPPVIVDAGTAEVVADAVPAMTLRLLVTDAVTGERLPRFEARVVFEVPPAVREMVRSRSWRRVPSTVLDLAGKNGRLSYRQPRGKAPKGTRPAWGSVRCQVEVRARGHLPHSFTAGSGKLTRLALEPERVAPLTLELRHPDRAPFDGELEARLGGAGGEAELRAWPIGKRGAGRWALRLPKGDLSLEVRIVNSYPPVGCRIRIRVQDASSRTETLTLPRGGTLLVGLAWSEELSTCPADLTLLNDLAPPHDRRFAPLDRNAHLLVDDEQPRRLAYLFPGRYTLTARPYLGTEWSSPVLVEAGSTQRIEIPSTVYAGR